MSCATGAEPEVLELAKQFGLSRNSHMVFEFDDRKVKNRWMQLIVIDIIVKNFILGSLIFPSVGTFKGFSYKSKTKGFFRHVKYNNFRKFRALLMKAQKKS